MSVTHDNRKAIAGTTARHLVWTSNGSGLRSLTCDGLLAGTIERTADNVVVSITKTGYIVGFPRTRDGYVAAVDMLIGATR